ncbi:BtrH N-terminal domain-containing protein [Paenibacillus sp. FSL H8-0537]|uniref:BtrH N-terminal domain-containing protein n=1 Tax=Paenibacillus sp. FSL H8-0537 TaxID=2921399 RepID=UPI00310185F1
MYKVEVSPIEGQLADCVTVYCIARLKAKGMLNSQDITGAFWRFNYRRDPLIYYWVSQFNTSDERNHLLDTYFHIRIQPDEGGLDNLHCKITNHLTAERLPMLFVERYEMPYDLLYYKKHRERHYVLVNGYDPVADVYHIVDFFADEPFHMIPRSTLEVAFSEAYDESQPMLVGSLDGIPILGPEQLEAIIQSNIASMTQNDNRTAGFPAMSQLAGDITIGDDFFQQYIPMLNLFSKLKHVSVYRKQHADFLTRYFDAGNLPEQFNRQSGRWILLANYLLKGHLTKQEKYYTKALIELEFITQHENEIMESYSNLTNRMKRVVI